MRMRIVLWVSCLLFAFAASPARACSDNEYEQCTLGICICLPKIGGDVGQLGERIKDEANRLVENVANELGKTPDAIRACIADVGKCVNEVMTAPVAVYAQAYIETLYRQSEGKTYPFSPEFVQLAQPHYDIDLNGITYADDIDTGHGMVLAYCDRVFFTRGGNLWQDKAELHLVLHELEHLVQCQKRGRRTFLSEYILKGVVDFASGRFNVHDVHEMEVAAEAKANALTDQLWAKIQSRTVPIPPEELLPQPTMSPSPIPPVLVPVRYCQTQVGTCELPATFVPMGTPCYCNTPYGQIPGTAF